MNTSIKDNKEYPCIFHVYLLFSIAFQAWKQSKSHGETAKAAQAVWLLQLHCKCHNTLGLGRNPRDLEWLGPGLIGYFIHALQKESKRSKKGNHVHFHHCLSLLIHV